MTKALLIVFFAIISLSYCAKIKCGCLPGLPCGWGATTSSVKLKPISSKYFAILKKITEIIKKLKHLETLDDIAARTKETKEKILKKSTTWTFKDEKCVFRKCYVDCFDLLSQFGEEDKLDETKTHEQIVRYVPKGSCKYVCKEAEKNANTYCPCLWFVYDY
jgi:hypothetical protein